MILKSCPNPYRYLSTLLMLFVLLIVQSPFLIAQNDSLEIDSTTITEIEDTLKQENNEAVSEDSNSAKQKIFYFQLNEEIAPAAWRKVKNAFKQAEEQNADIFFMELNTYGGLVDNADSIRTKFLKSKMKTVVWINNNAASAGALISIACDSIYMTKGANIGAVTVVDGMSGMQLPDKYQSYMRSTMRSTAEAKGRNPEIAEAMVDDRIFIEGVTDSGRVVTFTPAEAIKHGFCEGIYETKEELYKYLTDNQYEIKEYESDPFEGAMNFLQNGFVSTFLIMMIIGGIYAEIKTPGIGVPLGISMIAAVLYFGPNYVDGFAAGWEIMLFLIGFVLIALELFVIPGFGVSGVSGILAIIGGLALSLVRNDWFDFTLIPDGEVIEAFFRVSASIIFAGVASFFIGGSLMASPLFKRLSLATDQKASDGFKVDTFQEEKVDLKNAVGKAVTTLRPSGKVEINGKRYDASTESEYIETGEAVIVMEVRNNHLLVRPYETPIEESKELEVE